MGADALSWLRLKLMFSSYFKDPPKVNPDHGELSYAQSGRPVGIATCGKMSACGHNNSRPQGAER